MPALKALSNLFAELGNSGSLEKALVDCVQLACNAVGGRAAELRAFRGALGRNEGNAIFIFDPEGLLDRERGKCHQIAIRCGEQCVGILTLLDAEDREISHCQERLAPVDSVMAVLVAAVDVSQGSFDGLLGAAAFFGRVQSEINRARRTCGEMSVLHIRGASSARLGSREIEHPPLTEELGNTLLALLRQSDAVGILAPNHLAVVLPGTGNLGARIAGQRIRQIALSQMGIQPMAYSLKIKSFPESGEDARWYCTLESTCDKPSAASATAMVGS